MSTFDDTLNVIMREHTGAVDEHVCICGLYISQHREECYLTETAHSHYPALCCENCPCLSVEHAHPDVVGTPLESLPTILRSRTLSTRTEHLLLDHTVYTAERLETIPLTEVTRWIGFGKTRLREIVLTQRLWRMAVRRGDVTPKPLPETT